MTEAFHSLDVTFLTLHPLPQLGLLQNIQKHEPKAEKKSLIEKAWIVCLGKRRQLGGMLSTGAKFISQPQICQCKRNPSTSPSPQ